MLKRMRLVHVSETRWIERHESLMALVELFPAVVKCFEEMQVTGNLATSRNASLLLNSLRTCVDITALAIAQHMPIYCNLLQLGSKVSHSI